MEIRLEGISKRYTSEWILKDFSHTFGSVKSTAIIGPNGSGKTTLLLIISGWITPTEGTTGYRFGEEQVDPKLLYKQIDIAAPYLDLVEELTLMEFIDFHFRFKSLVNGITKADFIREIFLEKEKDKYIRHFSSGMKQRLKLGLGFYSSGSILLMDEPTSNLDDQGRKWYARVLESVQKRKVIIMASNQPEEFESCGERIKILDYKRDRI